MAYVVEITDAAAAANRAVAEYREEVGRRVRFESRADAEALAETLGGAGGPTLRLRSVHEDHPLSEGQESVDGYLDVEEQSSDDPGKDSAN